jgi:hypothetical protein
MVLMLGKRSKLVINAVIVGEQGCRKAGFSSPWELSAVRQPAATPFHWVVGAGFLWQSLE